MKGELRIPGLLEACRETVVAQQLALAETTGVYNFEIYAGQNVNNCFSSLRFLAA
jgi:hypothetical protein